MKKKTLIRLMGLMLTAMMLTGCGFGAAGGETPEADNTPETEAEGENEDNPDLQSSGQGIKLPGNDDGAKDGSEPDADHVYKYSETIRPYEDYEEEARGEVYSYDVEYALYTKDDGTATLTIDYIYTPGKTMSEKYEGKWSEDGESIDFAYDAFGDYDSSVNYTFGMSGDEIRSADCYSYDSNVAQAAGSYTCDDPNMGKLTLDISKTGSATLTMDDGTVYEGYIFSEGDRYDFYVSDGETGELLIDWYVDCSVNGTFRHSEYGQDNKVKYFGLYKCFGELGEFDINVAEDGSATAVIEVNGQKRDFSGWAYSAYTENGYDENTIGEIYMSNDDGYSINIELKYFWEEEKWNYNGTLTTPLAAG